MADYNYLYGKLYQFRLRYIFDDFEKTVWSPISKVPLPIPVVGSDFRYDSNTELVSNTIIIKFNTQDEEITAIEIAVREGNDGEWALIDTITKYDQDFNILVESNIEYTYEWQNDKVLFALDQEDTNRLFDYVPQVTECTELINENQLVDANYIEGYDNIDTDVWFGFEMNNNDTGYGIALPPIITYLEGGDIHITFQEIPVRSTTTIILNGPTDDDDYLARKYRAESDTEQDVIQSLVSQLQDDGIDVIQSGDLEITLFLDIVYILTATVRSSLTSITSYKLGKEAKFGIVYYDRALRSGSTNKAGAIYIPTAGVLLGGQVIEYNAILPNISILYKINHVPPVWAKYWQWVKTEDYHVYTQFVVNEWTTDDNYTLLKFNSAIENFNTAFPESFIKEWVYEKGDRLRIIGYNPLNTYNLNIIREVKDYPILAYIEDSKEFKIAREEIFVEEFDTTQWLIEVYRRPLTFPQEGIGEQYFEIGELNPILNPYTASRSHGHINSEYTDQEVAQNINITHAFGFIEAGDSYVRRRALSSITGIHSYPVEASNFDDYYESDVHNKGRINVVDANARRVKLPTGLRWGGSYITQSRINNLSRFLFADFDTVTEKYGEITRLKQIGEVLNARQEYRSTSIYVGRVELRQSAIDEQGFIAQSTNLLGTRYVSKEKWGCINPESEVQNGQISFYYDILNGAIVADGYNKPVPISDMGLKTYVKELSSNLLSNYKNIAVIGGFDSKNDFLFYNFQAEPKLTGADINISLIFKEGWRCFVVLEDSTLTPPELFASIGQTFVSFLKGQLYIHNTGSPNTFYGKFQPESIKLVFNQNPETNKIYRRLRINADTANWKCPEYGDIVVKKSPTFPLGMQTKIPQINLRDEEGFLFVDIPNNAGFPATLKNWINGEPMRGQALTVTLKNSEPGESNLYSVSLIQQPT